MANATKVYYELKGYLKEKIKPEYRLSKEQLEFAKDILLKMELWLEEKK
jgi:hypothetical protein